MAHGSFHVLLSLLLVVGCAHGTSTHVPHAPDRTEELRISDFDILLPYSNTDHKVVWVLNAFGGCFTWMSTKPHVVSVEALYEEPDCSTSARITATHNKPSRESATIVVKEQSTGRELRAEVFVDVIQSLGIRTANRKIHVEDEETVEAEGYDVEGNVFLTLAGLRFSWSISPALLPQNMSTVEEGELLQVVPFRRTHLKVDPAIQELEDRGYQGSSILVKGLKVGKANVTVRLDEPFYKRVPAHRVLFSVVENLLLVPQYTIFICPAAEIRYRLEVAKGEKRIAVDLSDSHQYVWETENRTVARVDKGGLVTAHAMGQTNVVVRNKNIQLEDGEPSSTVNVVEPARLSVSIFESALQHDVSSGNWNLINDRDYVMIVEAFDANNNELYISDNTVFNVTLNNTFFTLLHATANRSRLTVHTKKIGTTQVLVEFGGVKSLRKNVTYTSIRTLKNAVIYGPVDILRSHLRNKNKVVLPWDTLVKHTLQLNVTGGSGEDVWISKGKSVVSAGPGGVLTVQGQGNTAVTAVDDKNHHNNDTIEVEVKPPTSIEFISTPVDVEIDELFMLSVRLMDYSGQTFDNCSKLPIVWDVEDKTILTTINETIRDEEHHDGVCSRSRFRALHEGRTTIRARYKDIEAHVVVSSFAPLRILSPRNVAVVTLGSTFTIEWEGGPKHRTSGHFDEVHPSDPSKVAITEVSMPLLSRRMCNVTCLACGEQNINVKVTNGPTAPIGVSRTASARFACQPPSTIFVSSGDTHDTSNPLDRNATLYMRNNRDIVLNAVLMDDRTPPRRFDNFTSLALTWTVSNVSMANFVDLPGAHHAVGRRTLRVGNHEGSLTIVTSIVGYNTALLNRLGIDDDTTLCPFDKSGTISFTNHLRLVPNVELLPNQLTIFNHINNTVTLRSTAGSGQKWKFAVNTTRLVNISYEANSPYVRVTPLMAGGVRVTVVDVGLEAAYPAHSDILISDVSRIELLVRDKIQVGETVDAFVRCYDSMGELFARNQLKFMYLEVGQEGDVLQIKPVPGNTLDKFEVTGAKLGSGRFWVKARLRSRELVSSDASQVDVFSPLQVFPSSLLLVPGATFQVVVRGGPVTGTKTEFKVDNTTVADVDSATGLVTARKLGWTTLQTVAIGFDSLSEQHITFSKCVINVTVALLTGIDIHRSTNTLLVGSEMSVSVTGLHGETPFTFGMSPGITYQWSIVDTEVAKLLPKGRPDTVDEALHEFYALFLNALAWKTMRKDKCRCQCDFLPPGYSTRSFSDVLTLTVLDPLELRTPRNLLLPTGTFFAVETNKDRTHELTYEVVAPHSEPGVVTVDRHGVLTTKDVFGDSFLRVSVRSSERQTVGVKVDVRPVHQLAIVPTHPFFDIIPVGCNATFRVELHSDKGERFSTVNGLSFDYFVSHHDVLDVKPGKENGTFEARALRQGSAIIRVSLADGISDYLQVCVGNAIFPVNPIVHLGGMIGFTASHPAKPLDLVPYGWSSEDPRVLSINEESGVAHAHATGQTSVHVHGDVTSYTQVHVVRITNILVDTRTAPRITNILWNETGQLPVYRLPVTFLDEAGNVLSKQSSYIDGNHAYVDHNVQLQCTTPSVSWIYTTASTDPSGTLFCDVQPLSPSYTTMTQSPPIEEVVLKVAAADVTYSYAVSAEIRLPFDTAFVIRDKKSHITLSSTQKSTFLELIGSTSGVTVTPGDPSRLRIERIVHGDRNGTTLFQIHVIDDHEGFRDIPIDIFNFVTSQKEQIFVSFIPEGDYSLVETSCPPLAPDPSTPKTHDMGITMHTFTKDQISWLVILLLATILGLIVVLALFLCCRWPNPPPSTPTAPDSSPYRPDDGPQVPLPPRVDEGEGPERFIHHRGASPFSTARVRRQLQPDFKPPVGSALAQRLLRHPR